MTHHRTGWHSRTDDRPEQSVSPRIAVDLLGGDNAPAVVVDGALRACGSDPILQLHLVGPQPVADEVIAALGAQARDRVSMTIVDRGVGMAERVAHGGDPHTSIGAAMRALAAGQVDAVVSAGASGATVAAAVMGVGRIRGVRRPALAAVLPSQHGRLVLLDVGAGMQVSPADLIHHAALGAAYARVTTEVTHPRVGLLSVGSEPGKGDRLRRAADALLRLHRLSAATYVGLVEGNDVVTGRSADVIVTDGFTGNVLLKGIEAVLTAAPAAFPPAAVPRAAALLGVAGTVIVCHGNASGEDLASGIALAAALVRTSVTARVIDAVEPPAGEARVDDPTACPDSVGGPPNFAEVPR